MYDPTFEIFWRENREPDEDEFNTLLSIGCDDAEAAAILDAGILDFESWIEIYGESEFEEEVIPETEYSTFVII